MGLAAWVGEKRYEIGTADFLKALFSTIYVNLEQEQWGSRYPIVMNDFYSGLLNPSMAVQALEEWNEIEQEFGKLPAKKVVWDFEKRSITPPWTAEEDYDGATPAKEYFLTSDGKDLFSVLRSAFRDAADQRKTLEIT